MSTPGLSSEKYVVLTILVGLPREGDEFSLDSHGTGCYNGLLTGVW
jgi:hypothetical protein